MITKELCDSYIIKNGYIPLEYEIKGYDDTVLIFMDNQGYKYNYHWEKFKSSKNIKSISYSNIFSIDNIKLYLKLNNINLELLSDNFIDVSSPLQFRAECGHIVEGSWNGIKRKRTNFCKVCSMKSKENRRNSVQSVINLFKEKGYILIDSNYTKNNIPLLCKDSCGYIGKISYVNLKYGKKFDAFSMNNEYTIDNIRHFLKINNIEPEILSDRYNGSDKNLEWKCHCGNTFFKCWDYIKSKRGLHCEKCRNRSNRELKVRNFFEQEKIKYFHEFKFEDCKGIRPYPFDFYLPEYNTVIECDGEQHYRPVQFGGISYERALDNFNFQKQRDKVKDEYCKNNNINLIRLSYIDIDNNNYQNIIKGKLF